MWLILLKVSWDKIMENKEIVLQAELKCRGLNDKSVNDEGLLWIDLYDLMIPSYPLHQASYDVCRWLIKNGANVNEKDYLNRTALFGADVNKSRLLISYGIDINAIDYWEKTALFFSDYEASKLLINEGIRVNNLDKYGRNALFTADLDKSKLLVEAGIDIHSVDHDGCNALFDADHEKFKFLFDLGINIYQKNIRNETMLSLLLDRRIYE